MEARSVVPRGLSLQEQALLDQPSMVCAWCVACGRPAHDPHHTIPRSHLNKRFHDRIPVLSVDGPGNVAGCHALFHHNGGSITPVYDDGWWGVPDERAARVLNGKRPPELPRVVAGRRFRLR